MVTFFVTALVILVTVRVFGVRLMPIAVAAAAIGLAVNVFGLLPVPPTPLDAAAKEIRHHQRGQALSLTCHLRIYDALDGGANGLAAAERACAAAQAYQASRASIQLD